MPVSKLSLVISQTHQQHSPCHSNIQFHHYHDFKIMVDLELQPERPLFPHRHDVVLYMAAPPPPFLCSTLQRSLVTPTLKGGPLSLRSYHGRKPCPLGQLAPWQYPHDSIEMNVEQHVAENWDVREGKCKFRIEWVHCRAHSSRPVLKDPRKQFAHLPLLPSPVGLAGSRIQDQGPSGP